MKSKSVNKLLLSEDRIKFDEILIRYHLIDTSLESILSFHQRKDKNQHANTSLFKMNSFQSIIKFIAFSVLLTNLFHLVFGDSIWTKYLGDFSVFYPGKRFFIRFYTFDVSLVILALLLLYRNPDKLFWMTNFAHLQGLVKPKDNHINDIKSVGKLIKLFKFAMFIAERNILFTPGLTLTVFALNSIFRLKLTEYLTKWMFWHFYYMGGWVLIASFSTYISLVYFTMTCYYYRVRLDSFLKRFNYIIHSTSNKRQFNLNLILIELNDIMNSIAKSNQFWKYYIAIYYFLYIPLISALLNNITVYLNEQNIFVMIVIVPGLIVVILTLMYISIFSSMINSKTKEFIPLLYQIMYFKNTRTIIKLKV